MPTKKDLLMTDENELDEEIKRPQATQYKEPVYIITKEEGLEEIRHLVVNKSYAIDPETPQREILEHEGELDYIPFYSSELQKQGVWQCQRCNALTTMEDGRPEQCLSCERKSLFLNINPVVNPHIWRLPKYKEITFEPTDLMLVYLDVEEVVKRTLVFPEEIHYKIFSLWAMSSWKLEAWDTVGFLLFAGEIDSGKTRALDILSWLGYRMMQTAGVTFPAMIRATHYHNAGVLIDEIHDKLRHDTEGGREMTNFIKPSYRRGSHYTVADKDDQTKIISYNNYGFKAFAGEKTIIDRGLLSRNLLFVMEKNDPEITMLRDIQPELEDVQLKLLYYRTHTEDPPELPENFELRGRIREIFESIIRTAIHIGLEIDDLVEYAKNVRTEQFEELQDTIEYDILKALQAIITQVTLDDAPEEVSYLDIMERVWGHDLDAKDKRKFGGQLGYRIKKTLQLKTIRKTKGNVIPINKKTLRRLGYLFERYGVIK